MDEPSRASTPRTAGELRRRLAELGDPWTVDPRLGDDDPLPERPRGGQPEDAIPEESRLVALAADTDLREVLREQPPANPFLQQRWAEVGLLHPDQMVGLPDAARDRPLGAAADEAVERTEQP